MQELCVQKLCVHYATLILCSLLVLAVSSHEGTICHLLESLHHLTLLWPVQHSRISLSYCYLCVSDT